MPKVASKLYDSFIEGDLQTARELQRTMNSVVIDRLIPFGGIAYWKTALTCLGFDMGYTVAPAKLPNQEEIEKMQKMFRQAGLFQLV